MTSFKYNFQGQTYTIDLAPLSDDQWRAVINDREYIFSTQALSDGGWQLYLDDAKATVYTAAEGDRRYVHVNGMQYMLEVEQDTASKRVTSGRSSTGRLTAQMPGQVRAVSVSTGDSVVRGQTLVVLEAMKMELRVTAPMDATVLHIHVQPGAVVERDALLIELQAQPSA